MTLLILSFMAGVLTVAAPCILPLLPVIIGGTIATGTADAKVAKRQWFRPLVIAVSLALSVVIFTLLLKATTLLLGIPQSAWSVVSGVIVLLFGINLLFPVAWEQFMIKTRLSVTSSKLLSSSYRKSGLKRDVLMGAALGPVFSSCSPTYALIVAAILPQSFAQGLVYLLAYALGLAAILLVIAIAGQSAVQKMGWLSNPNGLFKKIIGILFLIVGVSILFGLDKQFQAYVIESGWSDPIMRLEQRIDIE